jgi:hypothetical protein
MQISRIRLSDKTSRLHPRHVVPKPAQAYEIEVPVKVLEWIAPALASPDLFGFEKGIIGAMFSIQAGMALSVGSRRDAAIRPELGVNRTRH